MNKKALIVGLALMFLSITMIPSVFAPEFGDDRPCGDCPSLYVYNGEYIYETYLNIYSNTSDVTLEYTLTVTPQNVQGVYKILLVETGTVSYIDQIKLYTIVCGVKIPLPLVKAVHSEDGSVLVKLWFSDDIKTELNNPQFIEAEFIAFAIPNATFLFQIEGIHIPE